MLKDSDFRHMVKALCPSYELEPIFPYDDMSLLRSPDADTYEFAVKLTQRRARVQLPAIVARLSAPELVMRVGEEMAQTAAELRGNAISDWLERGADIDVGDAKRFGSSAELHERYGMKLILLGEAFMKKAKELGA